MEQDNYLAHAAWMVVLTLVTLIIAIPVLGASYDKPGSIVLIGVIMVAGPLLLLSATMLAFKVLKLEHNDWL